VITLTLACILFVLTPWLDETPVRVVLGLLLVLFLPGYSLVAALFPRRGDPDGTRTIALSFGSLVLRECMHFSTLPVDLVIVRKIKPQRAQRITESCYFHL